MRRGQALRIDEALPDQYLLTSLRHVARFSGALSDSVKHLCTYAFPKECFAITNETLKAGV